VVWGGLIIGGGAVAKRRIVKLCGTDCVHLYENINYDCPVEERQFYKEQFYQLYDSLASLDNKNDENETKLFHEIVQLCREYMDHNNTIFTTFQRDPYWYQPLTYAMIATIGILLAYSFVRFQK
jgi:hypothetical protein